MINNLILKEINLVNGGGRKIKKGWCFVKKAMVDANKCAVNAVCSTYGFDNPHTHRAIPNNRRRQVTERAVCGFMGSIATSIIKELLDFVPIDCEGEDSD